MLAGDTEILLRVQTEVLEAVARGRELSEVGAILCSRVEAVASGVLCSILLVDEQGQLHPLAAPGLPNEFSTAIEGQSIGPKAGSCGTAAWRNAPVMVTDIANDPLWEDYAQLALPLGLRACWSSPIADAHGRVVATFAFYYGANRGPTDFERQVVEMCLRLLALAIEHERVHARNHHLAYYDALTDLPNRAQFNARLAEHVLEGKPFGLLLLDIDHLKLVNDSIGHAAGDALIRTIALRLASCRPDIMPCRLGGDEMAMLVRGCQDHAGLEQVAQRVLAAVSGMVTMGDQSIDAHVTLGGAVFHVDAEDADTLCQNADFALYQAKQTHRGGYVGFRPDLRTAIVERIATVRQLDQAMSEDRIIVHYQPIVRLDSAEIIGLEALARMIMPDGSVVSAGAFHAGLDDPRIAYQLTGKVLEQVARDVRYWLDQGIPFQHVGVNVTTGDFARGDLAQRIGTLFAAEKVPLRHIVLEVNESVFMGGSDQSVPHAVEALRAQGILVALDDFGTGFASLTHLLSFPVDVIKIDRSFVEKLGGDQPSEVVVRAILEIAQRLDMRVVAEGIETSGQVAVLRQFGCQMGQGYLFSRPVPATDVTRLLRLFGQKNPVPRRSRATG
ncbi:diguanylate cyclase/phosphodiesterase [Devosia lucknowensis]|uniref:Diguanylate cyclase/phosphodiesterase n=1 Tax=Devosia lucknowensis TaxID=1096929 RepID=A0A1Y6E870_9HYPH|nr:EAL domain-containing protein [Devosia lucknowensis]SMQ58827.1 diguanylate cyclase/phosphodiesterase [Devosia lucknowensis]